jgi:hypothetical protein
LQVAPFPVRWAANFSDLMDKSLSLASTFNVGGLDLAVISVVLLNFALLIWMVIDCITKESDTGNSKVVWLLVIVLVPLGPLIYLFFRKLPRR